MLPGKMRDHSANPPFRGFLRRMITDKMDARSEITHVAALVVRIATWLRGKAPILPDRIIFGHNYSIIPCDPSTVPARSDALDGAGREPDGMRMG
jgi:hypothetical protein